MIKTISCDPFWVVKTIKIAIKVSLENFLNLMREQRIFNLGEDTIFEESTSNDLQISAGDSFKGSFKIEQGPDKSKLVNINYDEKSYMNKSIWEGFIQVLEAQLTKPLE
ncbi:MAG: hypothetical protein ACW98F_07405 [Candidatus Hodarchaeales archaeon]|jgi:hypothetical protein